MIRCFLQPPKNRIEVVDLPRLLHILFRGRRQGRQPLNSAPPAPHEYADKCVTSVPERLELYGEARPKPPTLRRRAPKNTKNPSGGWGRAFWTESGSLISVSKSKRPPPPFGGHLKSEKSAVLTHFSDDFSLFEVTKCCNCIFAF